MLSNVNFVFAGVKDKLHGLLYGQIIDKSRVQQSIGTRGAVSLIPEGDQKTPYIRKEKAKDRTFFRKGQIGSFKDEVSEKIREEMKVKYADICKKLKYQIK